MKIDIHLVDPNLTPVCSWDDLALIRHVNRGDDLDNIFDVSIEIDGNHFSGFSRSLYSTVLDIMLNHRLIIKGKDYRFFISDEPMFSVSFSHETVLVSFFDRSMERRLLREKVSDFDKELFLQSCHGLNLLKKLSSDLAGNIFETILEDLASNNRADFLTR